MKYIKFYTIFALLFPVALFAQKEALDLSECIQIGLERNYEIRIVRNEQQIAENNYTIGNAGYLPNVELNAGYSGTLNNTEQNLSEGGKNKNSGIHNTGLNTGLNVDWTVFDGFKIQANYKKLGELKRMGELNTRLTIEDFIADLSAEYVNFIQQKIRLKNWAYAVSLSKERLRIVEARYNIGSMSRLDLQQARVDFNADSSNFIKQKEILYTSRIRLNQLMAVEDVGQNIVLQDSVIQSNIYLNKEQIWQHTLATNSALLLSERSIAVSELDYEAVKSRNYPYLRLNAGYGYNRNTYQTGNYDRQHTYGLNYGLTVGFTVFDGFNKKREQKNARLEIQNRQLQYEQLELALRASLNNIWMAYENNIELTNLEKENLQAARENYEIAIERYKLGELSGIELREAQNSLLGAEERLLQAEYDTKLCEISLLQISGNILQYLY